MAADENPWRDRFAPLLRRDEIRKRAELHPIPLSGFEGMSPLEAGIAIKNALEKMFYPSEQCLDILLEWVTAASAHCAEVYRGHRAFLEGVYLPQPPLPEFRFPLCLTGLAGTGKSALHKALGRIMPPLGTVTAEDGSVFPLESHRAITVRASSTPRDILVMLARREGAVRTLSNMVRKQAYRDGWAFLCLDEFQFATQSELANTRIVQMLMAMCYVGIPAAFIANFSMLHKLNSRNQEDIHRLLGNVRILQPESCNSADWRTLLRWQRDVAPQVFAFDPDGDAEALHHLSGGVKRAVATLLKIAFVNACSTGRTVNVSALEKAYKTADYAPFRTDIESLQKLYGTYRDSRKDLWCPIDGVLNAEEEQDWKRQRQQRSDENALEASMTVQERRALAELSKEKEVSKVKPQKTKVALIAKEKTVAEQLQDNLTWFQTKL